MRERQVGKTNGTGNGSSGSQVGNVGAGPQVGTEASTAATPATQTRFPFFKKMIKPAAITFGVLIKAQKSVSPFFKKMIKPTAIGLGIIIIGVSSYIATRKAINVVNEIRKNSAIAADAATVSNGKMDEQKQLILKILEYAKMTNDNVRVNLEITQNGKLQITVREKKKVGGFFGIGAKEEYIQKSVEEVNFSLNTQQNVKATQATQVAGSVEGLKKQGILVAPVNEVNKAGKITVPPTTGKDKGKPNVLLNSKDKDKKNIKVSPIVKKESKEILKTTSKKAADKNKDSEDADKKLKKAKYEKELRDEINNEKRQNSLYR